MPFRPFSPPERTPARRAVTWSPLALGAAGGFFGARYFHAPRDLPLPPALEAEMGALHVPFGQLVYYAAGTEGTPLLLIHSINAAGNSYEVKPLFDHYAKHRPVYSLELPGFGFSERSRRLYTPRLMTDAIHAVAAQVRGRHGGPALDAIALSLPSAYLARAALERPDDYASLGLISPTGFDERLAGDGPPGANRGSAAAREIAGFPLWGRPLFDALVSGPSMRYFLEKTWGSKDIDEGLLAYDQLSAHQPGAEHAPFCFLSGYLFPTDTTLLYEALSLPVWMLRGSRGDFVDYRRIGEVAGRRNWTLHRLPTGAFPHFEDLPQVTRLYDAFLAQSDSARPDLARPDA